MPVIKPEPPMYINLIFIQGVFRGMFKSNTPSYRILSNRAIVELILHEYHPESDIILMSSPLSSILYVEEE